MTEQGSDAMLPDDYDPAAALADDKRQQADEEARVEAATPSRKERGKQYPDPDETPDGPPPEYDPLPAS